MSIPQESKLNWSSEKPTFEEVKGKTVHFEFIANDPPETFCNSRKVMTIGDYEYVFGMGFPCSRYAVIDTSAPEPEILELDGVKPEMVFDNGLNDEPLPPGICAQGSVPQWYLEWGRDENNKWFLQTPEYPDKLTAITEWNKFVTTIMRGRQ